MVSKQCELRKDSASHQCSESAGFRSVAGCVEKIIRFGTRVWKPRGSTWNAAMMQYIKVTFHVVQIETIM